VSNFSECSVVVAYLFWE